MADSPLKKVVITIPPMSTFEDVRQVMAKVLSDFQDQLLAQFPIVNYGGRRLQNVGVPQAADDVVTLKYLEGVQPQPQTTEIKRSGKNYDKATFGILTSLTVSNGLTNYYICENGGNFVETKVKIHDQVPTGSDAILDIKLSTDDGANWNSIYQSGNSNKLVLPNGSTSTLTQKNFAITSINKGDLLRIDCLQAGSTNPGKGIEVVTKWLTNTISA